MQIEKILDAKCPHCGVESPVNGKNHFMQNIRIRVIRCLHCEYIGAYFKWYSHYSTAFFVNKLEQFQFEFPS